jgi:hypothetical protein
MPNKPGSASTGKLIVKADSVKESNLEILLTVGARNLPSTNSCFCANNHILMEIYRGTSSENNKQTWLKIHETETIADTVHPMYPMIKMTG